LVPSNQNFFPWQVLFRFGGGVCPSRGFWGGTDFWCQVGPLEPHPKKSPFFGDGAAPFWGAAKILLAKFTPPVFKGTFFPTPFVGAFSESQLFSFFLRSRVGGNFYFVWFPKFSFFETGALGLFRGCFRLIFDPYSLIFFVGGGKPLFGIP